jgi:uncharacterized membrane protein (UPF0127 family)
MPWRSVLSALLLVVAVAGGAYAYVRHRQYGQGEVTVAGKVRLAVEVADTDATREKGLGGHAPLAAREGMWFVFPAASRQAFWMKDMAFPIDIIWVREGRIVDMAVNVPPPGALPPGQALPLYRPVAEADHVLETQAGFAQTHGLKAGDTVEFALR